MGSESETFVRRSLLCCTRSNVEREEADAAGMLGPGHPDVDAVGLTLVGGKVTCVYRFCKTLAVARQALFKVAQYGDTCIVHPGLFDLRAVEVRYEYQHPLALVCLLHVEVVVADLGLLHSDMLLEDLNQVSLFFLRVLPHRTGVPFDDLLVIRHHQYLMISVINAALELDFGEHLGQGLFLVVTFTKVLADETSGGVTALSSTGVPRTCSGSSAIDCIGSSCPVCPLPLPS